MSDLRYALNRLRMRLHGLVGHRLHGPFEDTEHWGEKGTDMRRHVCLTCRKGWTVGRLMAGSA